MYIGCHYVTIEHLLSVPAESLLFVADTRILLVVVVQHALVTLLAVTGLITGMMGVVVTAESEMLVLYSVPVHVQPAHVSSSNSYGVNCIKS